MGTQLNPCILKIASQLYHQCVEFWKSISFQRIIATCCREVLIVSCCQLGGCCHWSWWHGCCLNSFSCITKIMRILIKSLTHNQLSQCDSYLVSEQSLPSCIHSSTLHLCCSLSIQPVAYFLMSNLQVAGRGIGKKIDYAGIILRAIGMHKYLIQRIMVMLQH